MLSEHYSPSKLSRRDVLRTMGILTATGLAACNSPTIPLFPTRYDDLSYVDTTPVWEVELDKVVVGAKAEGKLQINTILGQGSPRGIFDRFTQAFAGIDVEFESSPSVSLWGPKVIQEYKAGVYSWDVTIILGSRIISDLRKEGVIQPLRPLLFRPDILDDQYWRDGFGAGFMDPDYRWAYAAGIRKTGEIFINTDQVKKEELKSLKDLLDPKWTGKIVANDPSSGFTNLPATAIRLRHGSETLKNLFFDQKPTFNRDPRSIAESVIRGTHPIGIGIIPQSLKELQAQGVGKNVEAVFIPDLTYATVDTILIAPKYSPHPNTAQLFINWFLTKEGQTAFVKSTGANSRRRDVEPGNPDNYLSPDESASPILGDEKSVVEQLETERILKEFQGKLG